MTSPRGHAWIAGAGPGDPGLLTLAAAAALANADAVLYDALVHPAILRHAREGAELVYVGKRSGAQAMTQDEMNAELVRRAQGGQSVVRLKGGDPFVYGRGSEEAQACRAAGVPFTVIPGITSALAAPAYAGIPLTHRGVANSALIMSASGRDGSAPNWGAAAAADTIVILMGREKLAEVSETLIGQGKAPDTPAACIRWGTRNDQQVVTGTLETLPVLVEAAGLTAPVVTVVGGVAALAGEIAWFRPGPLAGKRVVVTRAQAQAGRLSERLRELGAEVTEAPVISIDYPPCGELAAALDGFEGCLAVTSANAVEAVWRALEAHGRDARALAQCRIAAIGDATAAALARHGLVADFLAPVATGAALADAMPVEPGNAVLYPCSSLSDRSFSEKLEARGAAVRQLVAYTNVAQPLDEQRVRDVLEADAILFTSASTVRNLAATLPAGAAPLAKLISIGEKTSEACGQVFGRVDREATEPSLDALVEATLEALS